MIVKSPNGESRETSVLNCTGYVATELTFNARDFNQVVALYQRDPSQFRAWLLQLQARFPENRVTPIVGHEGG